MSKPGLHQNHRNFVCQLRMWCDPPDQLGIGQMGKMHKNMSGICSVRASVGARAGDQIGRKSGRLSRMWCMVALRLPGTYAAIIDENQTPLACIKKSERRFFTEWPKYGLVTDLLRETCKEGLILSILAAYVPGNLNA